jgi:hypothetical protein
MSNIIKFPKNNPKFVPADLEEIEDRMDDLKLHHIHESLQNILPSFFAQLETVGFDFSTLEGESDPYIKDGAFVVESIKAMLCKYHGINHPFSAIADNIFVPDDEEEGSFKIVDNISVKFRPIEEGNG